jgi:hypothetical protein
MKTNNKRKSIADKVGSKEVLDQPSMLKQSTPPTLSEAVERKRPQPVSTNPIGRGGVKYYWDNTFMVFEEDYVRRTTRPNIGVEELEENSTETSTTSTSQF